MKKSPALLVAALVAMATEAFADDFAWPQMVATNTATIVSQAETAVAGDVLLTQQAQVQDVVLLSDPVSAEVRFMDNFTVDVDLPLRAPLYAMQLGWRPGRRVYCAMTIVQFEAAGRPAFSRACLSDDNSDGTFDNIWVIPSRDRPARVGGGLLVDTHTLTRARFESVPASTIEPVTLQIVYGGLRRIELLGGNNFPVRVLEDGEPANLGTTFVGLGSRDRVVERHW